MASRILHRHSDTAEATAAMRASECLLPASRRLIDDPVARDLVRRLAYRLPTRFGPAAMVYGKWCFSAQASTHWHSGWNRIATATVH